MTAFNKDTLIELIKVTAGTDAEGFPIDEQESTSKVWGCVTSVDRSEFYNAGQRNLKPEYRITIWAAEYDGEEIVEIDGERYGVYRTYRRDYSDEIELYVERKAGDVV